MITVESGQGRKLKNLSFSDESFAFHKRFGFVPEAKLGERSARRRRHGLKANEDGETLFRFRLEPANEGFSVEAVANCEAKPAADHVSWDLLTSYGKFTLVPAARGQTLTVVPTDSHEGKDSSIAKYALIAMLLLSSLFLFGPRGTPQEAAVEVLPPPVQVTVVPEVQKAVKVPSVVTPPEFKDPRLQDTKTQRAISQKLGFLGLLGKKNLTKALGGAVTSIKDASPGAGPGGKGGSGGEFLVGLGQGVHRATVGNTGVAGLGGVRTKNGGAGGGAGGYGNSMIGSGEGRALSTVVASQDMVIEGGLDRAVVAATIAKYLSQVRACYEEQLQGNPGLSGQVMMHWVINGTGDVASANVARSTLGNAKVESCITTRLKTWKFPQPVGGVNVPVNYPFNLRPVGT